MSHIALISSAIVTREGPKFANNLSAHFCRLWGTISLYSLNHVLLDCGAELPGGRRTVNIENCRDGAGIRQPLGENG